MVERSGEAGVQITISFLQKATTMSSNCKDSANSLNLVNALFKGPQVGQCLAGIAQALPTAVEAISKMDPVSDLDAISIVNVLRTVSR